MIIRIMSEGQWQVAESALADLNEIDDAVAAAVAAENQDALSAALLKLHAEVKSFGTQLPDDALTESDLILPDATATLAEVAELLSNGDTGLIPG